MCWRIKFNIRNIKLTRVNSTDLLNPPRVIYTSHQTLPSILWRVCINNEASHKAHVAKKDSLCE